MEKQGLTSRPFRQKKECRNPHNYPRSLFLAFWATASPVLMNYPSRTNICGSLPFAAELQSPLVPAPGLGADPRTALITPNPLYFPSQKALGAPYFDLFWRTGFSQAAKDRSRLGWSFPQPLGVSCCPPHLGASHGVTLGGGSPASCVLWESRAPESSQPLASP